MKNLNLKSKLLLLSIIPVVFIVILSSMVLGEALKTKENLQLTKDRIVEAEAISKVIHFLQTERGLSIGLLSQKLMGEKDKNESKNTNTNTNEIDSKGDIRNENKNDIKDEKLLEENKNNLQKIRKNLDEAIMVARAIFSQNGGEGFILNSLNGILENRKKIDLFLTTPVNVKVYYTNIINSFLDIVKKLPSLMEDKENRNLIQSYSYLVSSKEALGLIRASLNKTFINDAFVDDAFLIFISNLEAYNTNTANFIAIAPQNLLTKYEEIIKSEPLKEMFNMINLAIKIQRSGHFNIESSIWFEKSTQSIDLIQQLEEELFRNVNNLIEDKIKIILYKISFIIGFLVFTAITLTALLTLLVKKILYSANLLEQNYTNSLSLLEQYKSTVDKSFIVSKTDPKGIITYVNEGFCKISGYSKSELMGKPHNIVRHPDMEKEVFKGLWYSIKNLKEPWFGEVKNRKKDGSAYWVRAFINPILDENGNAIEYIGMRTDITNQKLLEEYFNEQLKISEKNFDYSMHLSREYEKAIDSSTILSRTDKDGNITYANEKFLQTTGYNLEELLGKDHNIFRTQETTNETYKQMWDDIMAGKIWRGLIKNKTKCGKYYWANTTIVPIKNLDGEIIEYLAIRYDATEIIEQKKAFEEVAKTDSLTGYGNRFKLNGDLKRSENVAVAILNLDNFRQINDFYGQQFGDLIIIAIANKIYKNVSDDKNLKFYRLQGDEFIILAINYPKDLLVERAKKILEAIKENMVVENEQVLISCSCGVSFEDKEILLSSANMALKIAKHSNTELIVYDKTISLNGEYENNITYARKLTDAIKNNNIIAYYQPIVNNLNLEFEKYETLVRMIDIDGKVISPYFFLDIAKKTRQYFDITKSMILQSFEMFKDKNIEFSINLSIKDITEPELVNYIIQMVQKYKIGSKVVFEIVESESIVNFEDVSRFIQEVKKYDCKIAIDDFGTGYSNFEYLIKLKADYLKLDGSLIRNIDKDENSLLVVSTIVEFSKKLGMKTIAEFVENENIFKIVKELGIDYSQGYYFSAPSQILL